MHVWLYELDTRHHSAPTYSSQSVSKLPLGAVGVQVREQVTSSGSTMVGGLTGSNGERASMANKHKKQQNYSCRAVMSAGEPGEAIQIPLLTWALCPQSAVPGGTWCSLSGNR